jgi:hypothetical protein
MEPDRNIAVQGKPNNIKINLELVAVFVALLSAVASFFVGFFLGEDSSGGAYFDFYSFHWPIIERFSTMPWGAAVADYPSATNPLLYMIVSVLPLHADQKIYHVITFVVALLIWPLLSWAYYRRYSNYGIGWWLASFGASTILISPCFRSSAFWGTTDYLPFAFCAVTYLLLSRFQDFEAREAPAIRPFGLVVIAAVSACAFYTRQYYAFLPVVAAWIVLTRTKTSSGLVVGIFCSAMIPEVFLVRLWHGLNPPTFHGQFHPVMSSVPIVGSNIALLSAPLIVGCMRRSLGDVLPEWWGVRSTAIGIAGLLVFIMALRATEWPEHQGGGLILKAGLRMGALGTPFILTVSYFGLVAAIVFSMRSTTNALLAGTYLVPFFLTVPTTTQRYLEPSLAVALFLFADTKTARTVFNKRVLVCNFVFTVLILAIGIVYYDLFHHAFDFLR